MTFDAPSALRTLRLERHGPPPVAAATSIAAWIFDELGPVARSVRVDVDVVELDIGDGSDTDTRARITALLRDTRLSGWQLRLAP